MTGFAKRRVSEITTLSAPVGGIDDTSPLANMDSNYAIDIINFFPTPGTLKIRYGYREQVTNLPSPAKTLMPWFPSSGTPKLFAATDNGIYDVTSPSSTPTLVYAGITNGLCVFTTFSNTAGQWLIVCNGVNAPVLYDGTTWIVFTNSATPTTPGQIGNILPVASIAYVHQHKNRLWFAENGTLTGWYLDVNAVAGTPKTLPIGSIITKGGYLNSIFSGTSQASSSVDDFLVFQTSNGELVGYGGYNPDDATNWTMLARFAIGRPLSRRSAAAMSSDTAILTQYGLVALSDVINGNYKTGASWTTASGRISRTLNNLVRQFQFSPGWELQAAQGYQYMILNVPSGAGITGGQLVMNSITGAWCRFDLPALTFCEFGDYIYFSDIAGRVLKYGDTSVDNVLMDGSGGSPIIAGFQQAYSYFGDPASNKHYKLVRPVFLSTDNPNYLVTISPDFAPGGLDSLGTPGLQIVPHSVWDQALWDAGQWSPSPTSYQKWDGVFGAGYCASLIIKVMSTIDIQYSACNWAFEKGVSL